MEKQRLFYLLTAHAEGRLTEDERRELAALAMDPLQADSFQQQVAAMMEEAPDEQVADKAAWKTVLAEAMGTDKVHEAIQIPRRRTLPIFRRWGWAAVLIPLLAAAGLYFLLSERKGTVQPAVITKVVDIAPGKNGAVLTLADGSQVVLDSMGNGVVATQKGAQVLLKSGQLSYKPLHGNAGVDYNLITTPKGRQFRLVLPDGTAVWMNAASSLKFPTSFTGKSRQVDVTGEAYFEVAQNANLPFRVNVNGHTNIEVLGTRFNVNAYSNEHHINTTLLDGSVKVTAVAAGASATLKPGQQAQTDAGIKVLDNVDIDKIIAWKDGLFNFNGASLQEVMRQLERWYDIEVVYEKGVPDIKFWGKMTKDVTLNGLLIGLQKSDVHLRIEGRKLIVLP